jgi:hypothetical protein
MAIQTTSAFARPPHLRQLEDEPELRGPARRPLPQDTSAGTPGGSATDTAQGAVPQPPGSLPEEAPQNDPQTSLLDRLPPPQSREPAAYAPFIGRAAWNTRRPATVLDDLPEPEVRARMPAPAAVAALAPPTPTPTALAASMLTAPPANPGGGYVGERPVQAQWLQDREAVLRAIRADYGAQRAQAQAQPPTFGTHAPGWVEATLVTDESGQTRSASGAATVFVAEAGAQPSIVGYDESGPVYGPTPGRTLEFDEQAFAAFYRAQGGPPLQALARLYDTDAATLLSQHPQLWQLATQDHALNAGPPPPGRAMGDASQLGMLDLYMADPQIQGLISTYGGSVAPASSGIAQEQVRIHGRARYEQMTRLSQAMEAVRNTYSAALLQAESSGGGIGWVERQRTVTVSDESGATRTEAAFLTDESGARTPLVERVFDPDVFTRWYTAQDGQANRAFADFYGQSHTQYSTDESGVSRVSSIRFDNANWTMQGVGGAMSHRELVRLDPNHTPRLNNDSAVGFDLEVGWATHHGNIHQKRDWLETVVQVAAVAVVSYFTAGAASGWAAAAGWGATASAVAAGAAAGAAGSLVSGAMNGNLAFKDILRGALAGGLSGGLLAEFGGSVANSYGPAGTVALRTTVQGGIQALLGGSFKDGALAGFASGLADVTSAGISANIDKALAAGTMDVAQATVARNFVRVLGSAIRAAGNPDDPASGFASALLSDVLNQVDPAGFSNPRGVPPAFDDEGNLMPGVVDPHAPPAQQRAQLAEHLQAQGFSEEAAAQLAEAQFAPRPLGDPFAAIRDTDEPSYRELLAAQLGIPVEQLQEVGFWSETGRSLEVLRGFVEGLGFSVLGTGEAVLEIAKSPGQFINGVKALLTSPEAREHFAAHVLDQVRTDVRLLEGAWAAGDLRAVGQQIGKLTGDLAQTAGGVEALVRLGVSTASVGGRLLLRGADALSEQALQALRISAPGLFDAAGRPLMDFRGLSSAQKGLVGELMGNETVQRLVPNAQRIGRVPGVGETGIDDLFRVGRSDVDFVVVEYKFGSSALGNTRDGLQMSDGWLQGTSTGYNRILESVNGNRALADTVSDALRAGRVERWVVHTDPLGNVTVGIVDASGKFIPRPSSGLLGGKP